jgi:hypothetical protein
LLRVYQIHEGLRRVACWETVAVIQMGEDQDGSGEGDEIWKVEQDLLKT